jgi:CubicO group peptidase (beta-lactamase class C family)
MPDLCSLRERTPERIRPLPIGDGPPEETRFPTQIGEPMLRGMSVRSTHRFPVLVLLLLTLVGCSLPLTPPPDSSSGRPPIDYAALEADVEKAISTGPPSLDNVRAVLVSVDGESRIAHYRHSFTESDHAHVFSVTKSVLSILIGIAIADGVIADLDQPLSTLLPKHHRAMTGDTGSVTLRHLMTMTAGFRDDPTYAWTRSVEHGVNYVDVLLERRQEIEPGRVFIYSNADAHVASAVLAAALERAGGEHAPTVLDYARERLFDPLGIQTRPSFSQLLPDWFAPTFVSAGFGWGTDPDGVPFGGYGLRLTAADMVKIGELYRRDGVWDGKQIVPANWVHQSTAPSRLTAEYGLFWWRSPDPEQTQFTASGSGGQRIHVLPDSRTVIVYLSDAQSDRQVDDRDVAPLDKVIADAFHI